MSEKQNDASSIKTIKLSEASKRYGMCRQSLRNKAIKGQIPAKQCGKLWYVLVEEMDKLMGVA